MNKKWKQAAAGAISAAMILGLSACGAAEEVTQRVENISGMLVELQASVDTLEQEYADRAAAEAQRLADEAEAAAAAEAARLAEEARIAAEEAATKLIGERDESRTKIKLFNETLYDLVSVSIKAPDEDYTANLLEEGDTYVNGEKRYLFYDRAPGAEGEYDVRVVMDGDWTYTLHDFPFGDIEEGQILYDYDGDFCYLVFTSLASQESVSTFEEESAIRAAEIEAARAAAAAAAAAAAQSYSYSSGGDTCLTDGLFW